MNYIPRQITPLILRAEKYFPVVVITGPRQSGKSTLARTIFPNFSEYNFEDVALREKVSADPKSFLDNCGDKVILDEVQHIPDLFSYIQIVVDCDEQRRFILSGSNNFALMEKITQSLAGRAALFTLLPLSLKECGAYSDRSTDELLCNGFYPSVITDKRPADLFYPSYYSTYVERDVRQLKNISSISQFQTFMRLLAGRCGTEFNASSLSTDIGTTSPTIKSWLSILETSYIAFRLSPYYANINKRLTKTPKIYFYDTGLLCFLLGIRSSDQIESHPLRGAIFENLAVIELLKEQYNTGQLSNLYFYRENRGYEVDIVRSDGLSLDLFEVKSAKTFHSDFMKNLTYLKSKLGNQVRDMAVVYDGDYIPPAVINVRQLTTKY